MRGWLIVNAYVKSEKFEEIFRMLIQAGERRGCEIERYTNEEVWFMAARRGFDLREAAENVDFIIFWDKDVKLAKMLEGQGMRLFNSADSIAVCDDKAKTHIALLNQGIRMPKTYFGPKTFRTDECPGMEYYLDAAEDLGYPCVVKECFGSFGQQVYLAHNKEELISVIRSVFPRNFFLQEYIASSRGRDIRIHVAGNRAAAAMYRYNPSDFRANLTNGGKMKPYVPNVEQEEMALKVCRILGLDFGGIDILFGEGDEPVFCEANSNAHFKNLYDCTGINAADEIMEHILAIVRSL